MSEAKTEHRYSREELEVILANRWPSVFCKEGHPGTPNQFAKNLVAFFGSHPRAEMPAQPAGGVLESDPALFDILNSALGTMHYHRLMGALNLNGYVITNVAQPVAWTNKEQLGFLKSREYDGIPMAMWSQKGAMANIPLYAAQPPAAPVETDDITEALNARQADINETMAELRYEAGMYKSLYENAVQRLSAGNVDAVIEALRGSFMFGSQHGCKVDGPQGEPDIYVNGHVNLRALAQAVMNAVPQGAQEPIYYRYRTKLHGGDWMVVLPGDLPKDKSGWEIEPLYGAPPHSPGYAGMLKEALDRFCLTQKPEHYGPEHWSNRARSSLSLSRPHGGGK